MKLKSRSLLRKKKSEKGLSKLVNYYSVIELSSKVVIKPNCEVKKAIPNRRFCGKIGVVVQYYPRKKNYLIKVRDTVIVVKRPHLKIING